MVKALRTGNVWLFFLLTFIISWLVWAPLVGRPGGAQGALQLVLLLGAFGPSIAGVIFIYATQDADGRRDFWRRVFGFGRIDLPGWAIIVGLPLVYNGITLLFYWIITRSLPDFAFGAQMLSAPGLLVSTLVVTFLAGPFSEELGWRGYAIDALLKDNTVVLASLILGVVWWAWHIPLFFIEGLIQYELGLFTLEHAGYIVSTVSLSIHMTWLYLRTDRSIMAAILLHFTANLVSQIVLVGADLGPVWVVLTIVMNLIITAAIILLPGGLRTAQVTAVPAASD